MQVIYDQAAIYGLFRFHLMVMKIYYAAMSCHTVGNRTQYENCFILSCDSQRNFKTSSASKRIDQQRPAKFQPIVSPSACKRIDRHSADLQSSKISSSTHGLFHSHFTVEWLCIIFVLRRIILRFSLFVRMSSVRKYIFIVCNLISFVQCPTSKRVFANVLCEQLLQSCTCQQVVTLEISCV